VLFVLFCGPLPVFIDSHAHLDMPAFDADRSEVISRARAAGVDLILEIAGSDIAKGSLDVGLALTEELDMIYAAVGVHPHEASIYDSELEARLLESAGRRKVVGWGEIGLDYHYDYSPRDVQRRVFGRQIEMARQTGLPVIVHTREAEDDTISILREHKGITGVLHCFTGTQTLADAALDLGLLISFSGVVTFKNSNELRAVAASVPMDRMLIETDSPYLAPVPFRGRRNEPAFVRETAGTLASLHGVATQELGEQTSSNFMRLFAIEGAD
jgi:TatD DNase family protein